MSDDSRNTPEQGDDQPDPIAPPAGAINDGDDEPDAPAPPPPPPGPAAAAAPTPPAPVAPVAPPTPVAVDDDSGAGPVEPSLPLRASRAGSTGAVVAIGTGLLGAAVVIAAFRARSDGDLDWSNYGCALGATAVLLVIAVLGALSGRTTGGRAREEVVTWPGVVGILSTALVIGVGINEDDNWVAYLIGAVMVALAVVGYVAARRAAFVVVAILGLVLIYAVAIDDVVPDSLGEDHPGILAAVLVAMFVVVVTLLGWALPSRAVSGVVVGTIGLVGLAAVLVMFVAFRYVGMFFGGMPMFLDDESMESDAFNSSIQTTFGFEESEVWWVLVIAGVLVALWALAASVTNHSGFTILAIAAPTILVPLASAALAAEHPTAWAGILAAAGGVVLLGGALLARLRGQRTAARATEPSV